MDFATAEEKFQELQARIRRGEPLSEDQYQEELAKLMVQDDSGVFWSLEPGTGRWLYFNGTEWMPGTPPRQAAPPAAMPVQPAADAYVVSQQLAAEPPIEPAEAFPPAAAVAAAADAQPSSYYVPSDVTRPIDYSGSETTYPADSFGQTPSFASQASDTLPPMDSEGMPTYVRMPEPETSAPTGGIPPRPVREVSPLAVPGGERAWLPFAFGALVLLLCAVILFFGLRGLPQFSGGTANQEPTEEPTEQVVEVLPTATVELVPTKAPRPTQAPTEIPQPTEAPKAVTATTNEVLNIRQGPSRTTTSLGKLPKGTTVTVVGRNGDATWLRIQIPDKTDLGWVSAEFVTVDGDVNTLPVVSGDSTGSAPAVTETPTG
jgi:hypothetical protein